MWCQHDPPVAHHGKCASEDGMDGNLPDLRSGRGDPTAFSPLMDGLFRTFWR